ncbi:helix-turn-helix transcriptional regulator [Tumebacillus avium]|nr:helix-turn-helix transcriptional regulator [Tumebacillus avium]
MVIDGKGNIGEKIRTYREERGLSQKELAEKADVSPSTISKVEGGVFTPSPDKLQRVADALGIPFHELIDFSAELEISTQVMIVKIFVERKEYHYALKHIADLEKRGDLLEHQKQDVILFKAESYMRTGRTEEAITLLSELRTSLEKFQGDEHLIADVFNRLGNAYFLASNITHAHAHYVRAHQLSLTFAIFDELAAKISYNLGMICSWLKKPSEATEHLENAERYFRDISDHIKLADTLFRQGQCYRDLNKMELAERYLNESFVIYKSHNHLVLAQHVRYNLASTVTALNEFDLAIEQLLECIDNFKELQSWNMVVYTYVRIAEIHLENGRYKEAEKFLVEAQQVLRSVELPEYDHNNVYAFYYRVLARSLYTIGKYSEAIEMSFNSSELYGKIGVKRDEADSLEIAVDSYLKLGDTNEAIQLSRRISDLLRYSLDIFANPEV